MDNVTLLLVTLAAAIVAYQIGMRRSVAVVKGQLTGLHSLPKYHGHLTALWALVPAMLLFVLWTAVDENLIARWVVADLPASLRDLPPGRLGLIVNDIRNLVHGNIVSGEVTPQIQAAADSYALLLDRSRNLRAWAVLLMALAGAGYAVRSIRRQKRARNAVEKAVLGFMLLCSTIAVLTTVGIVASVLFEAIRFFDQVPLADFLFGLTWSPQTALRADQVGASGSFGAVPLFLGTFLISLVAMLVAAPIGLMSAVYLSEYANRHVRAIAKPLLEILAGIPTVVYGFFAALTVAPLVRDLGTALGLEVASESALAAGLVMGIMIIPFVSSLSDDVINAVPQAMRDGSYALGATQSETVRRVILPAALPGIVGGLLLAVSRAIGETMIVVMAAGLSANLTVNPLEAVTTVTVQIVTLLTGDQEFDSAKTLAAFALGLVLFVMTLVLNVIALTVVRKYREQYE
jgi:phosphate transport system permease protein